MKKVFVAVVIIIIAIIVGIFWFGQDASAPQNNTTSKASSETTNSSFNKHKYSLTDASSLWVIVNKLRPLSPVTYTPKLVVPNIPLRGNITSDEKHVNVVMAPALEKMVAAASSQGITINLQSGYRSYQFQSNLYNSYVARDGKADADTYSARPGHSEHQTGLAADLGGVTNPACNVDQCFANTVEGKWLAANAYKYGFVLRYVKGGENITGYEYEPWHFRYVGQSLSTEMHKQGITTLEQFFGLADAPTYN